MKVNLVSVTKPVHPDFLGNPDMEAILVHIARVSSSRDNKTEDPAGLIGYLMKNKHWSPFEMVGMCVEITTSRAISLQIVRHRSFSYQQFSQRYAESVIMEPVELRMQAAKNRQSSTEKFDPLLGDSDGRDDIPRGLASKAVADHLKFSADLYNALLLAGVAKESARFVLPEATQTRLYMNGTMRSWIHYLQLRDHYHAQLEHQLIAKEIKKIFINQMPNTSQALEWI